MFVYPPLASAYLKCTLDNDTDGKFSVKIVPTYDSAGIPFGNRQIINTIAETKPDIVGLSLSVWNIERSLYIAGQLKNLLPGINIVAGGPEVSADNNLLLNEQSIDYLVLGEGERTFRNLCQALLEEPHTIKPLAGVAYRDSSGFWVWPESQPLIDPLDEIPSPHLRGALESSYHNLPCIEISRGCIYKCIYCNDYKGYKGVRLFSLDRLTAEMQHYLHKGAQHVHLIDPTFSSGNRLEKICEAIKKINSRKKLRFLGELRAEHIDAARADLLKEANFGVVEVGFQCASEEALNNINRYQDKEKFIEGVRLLSDRKIKVAVDLILGLPGDNPEGIKLTCEYLNSLKNQNGVFFKVFLLSVLPGTPLRKKAQGYGIKYMRKPPYFISETPTLSKNQIQSGYRFFVKHMPSISIFQDRIAPNPFFPFHQGEITKINNSHNCPESLRLILIELSQSQAKTTYQELNLLKTILATHCSNRLTVHIRGMLTPENVVWICDLLDHLSTTNLYCILNIVIEQQNIPDERLVELLRQSVQSISYNYTRYDSFFRYCLKDKRKKILSVPLTLILPERKVEEFFASEKNNHDLDVWAQVQIHNLGQAQEYINRKNVKHRSYLWEMGEEISTEEQIEILLLAFKKTCRPDVPPSNELRTSAQSTTGNSEITPAGERVNILFRNWAQMRILSGRFKTLDGPDIHAGVLIYRLGEGIFSRRPNKHKANEELSQLTFALLKSKGGLPKIQDNIEVSNKD
jgi:radical SAM superfamily enzyme YgiQ (UPF0313 family)